MEEHWNATVLAVVMRWDYGDPARGPSCEDAFFLRNMEPLVDRLEPLWIDEYLDDPDTLRELVLRRVRELQPDLVFFVPFRHEFSPATLDEVRALAPTLAWFSDDQWRFADYTSQLAPHYTHVCSTDPLSLPAYRALGVEPILTQWGGIEPEGGGEPLPPDGDFAFDVMFIGMADPFRRWMLAQLLEAGFDVSAFGAGWPAGRVAFAEMPDFFRHSRVNLNVSNSRNHDVRFLQASAENQAHYAATTKLWEQPKARHFEIALAGGFQLSNYFIGMEEYFVIGDEIAIYTTPDECVQQVRRFLADAELRCEVARAGWERSRREHTWPHRMRGVLARALGPAQVASPAAGH